MKKENRKTDQERRAAERKKRAARKKLKRQLLIFIPILVIFLVIAVLIVRKLASREPVLGELLTDTSLTVAEGDYISMDFIGTIDGEEFEGGSADDATVEIGSGTYVEGFEKQFIGAHPGDEVEVNITFPEDYSYIDVAGQDAVIMVTINGIYEIK